jgi:DNA-binding MarR family transcriptional regulator
MRASDLHRLAHRLREAAMVATADPGEPPASYGEVAVVEDVSRNPRTTVGDVALRTGLAQSLVSRLVARLSQGGILVTERDPADGRRTLVSVDLNAREEVLLPRGNRSVGAALAATFRNLGEVELAHLEAILEEASALVRSGDQPPRNRHGATTTSRGAGRDAL